MTQPTLTTLFRRATEANATFKLAQIRLVRRPAHQKGAQNDSSAFQGVQRG